MRPSMRNAFRSEMYLIALTSMLLACPAAAPAPASTPAPAPIATPTATPTPAPVTGAKTSPPAPDATPAATPQKMTERPAKRVITAADTLAHTQFMAAMQIGRAQTRAKAYTEAIAAFDQALVHQSNHPRALAERGYAKLLAKDLTGARADLELARQRTQDPARLGPIWFNVGLVAEASGNHEGALRAFALSNEMHPTKAAAARLAGKQVCTAEIDRKPQAGTSFPSWKALHDHLRADTEEPVISQDSEIHKRLCRDPRLDAHKVWDLCFYNAIEAVGTNSHGFFLVGQAPDKNLVLFEELNFIETGACQTYGHLTVTPVGELLHARYVEFEMDWERVPLDPSNPEPDPVSCDGEGDEVPPGCEFECVALSGKVDDYILDLTGKQRLLRVRRTTNTITPENVKADPDRLPIDISLPIAVTVSDQGVTLKGGGCDETVPLRAATP